jgi:hypothetical protein
MMSVLHGDRLGFEPVSVSKSADFFGVVVGHEKAAGKTVAEGKQPFMIYLKVGVEPGTRAAFRRRSGNSA